MTVSPAARPLKTHHALVLAMAVATVASCLFLQVRSRQQVVIAYLEIPLPALCAFQRIVGHNCPGCGLTRSVISLAHGDVPAAWSYNPAGLVVFAIIVLQIPYRAVEICRSTHSQRAPCQWPNYLALWSVAIALVGQWLVRSIGSWIG